MIWTWQSDVQQVSSGWRLTSVGVEVEEDSSYDGEEDAPGVVGVQVRGGPRTLAAALSLPVVVVSQVGRLQEYSACWSVHILVVILVSHHLPNRLAIGHQQQAEDHPDGEKDDEGSSSS